MSLTGGRLNVASRTDARARLLSDLATGPARKGYGVAYDLLGNRAEAEEAVQEALARACEAIDDLRDPEAAPAWFLRIVTTMCLRTLRRRKLRRAQLGSLFERLDQLSAQQRTALVLRYGHDLAVGDIATMRGVEPATAKTHLVRGLARLRDLMEEHR